MIVRRIGGMLGVYQSVYPPAYSSTYVKATTTDGTQYPHLACNPALSVIGSASNKEWLAAYNTVTNQRFHIDLGSPKLIYRVYYENYHTSGNYTDRGLEHFTLWGSNAADAFAELTYATDTDWTQLTTDVSVLTEHVDADQADPHYVYVTPSGAYRYYAFKFADNYGSANLLGIRRIELQEMI